MAKQPVVKRAAIKKVATVKTAQARPQPARHVQIGFATHHSARIDMNNPETIIVGLNSSIPVPPGPRPLVPVPPVPPPLRDEPPFVFLAGEQVPGTDWILEVQYRFKAR